MAELLRLGYTMLNEACPECNTPIFRDKDGELICASCNRKIIIVNEKDKNKKKQDSKHKQLHEINQTIIKDNHILLTNTYDILEEKINWLLEIIKQEDQTEKLKEYIYLLRDLYNLMEFLGFINS